METKSLFLFTFLFFTLLISNNTEAQNQNEDGSLDELKAFKPEEKYFKAGLKSMHFVIETRKIEEVDQAFTLLVQQQKLPVKSTGFVDGTFTGESPYDAFDYKHVATITIKDEKIVTVDYNEVHKDGSNKKTDEAYNKEMSSSGTSPAIAYPQMEKQLLKNQELNQLDAVSGASYSLYRFRYALVLALMKAQMASRENE